MSRGWAMAAAAGLLLTAVAEGAAAAGAAREAEPAATARAVFLEKCSRCHGPERAYPAVAEGVPWARTVASMAVRDRQWMPPEAVRSLLAYRLHLRPHQRAVFARSCGGCHEWEALRTGEKSLSQWRTLLNYMSRRCAGELTAEERELLLLGLASSGD